MDVRPSYKQTEVGVIPEDWELDFLGQLAQVSTGSRNTQDHVDDGQYPFFVRSQIVERIDSYSFDGEAVLTAGDGVGTGKVFHYINGKFDTHQRVYCISNFSNRINGYFFYLYFSSHFYARIMQMTAKSSVDSVRREMIAGMLIPFPLKLAEQRAIADALSDADALIESLKQLLTKKRQIKKGAMQELLTSKKRLPGFSGKWEVKRLRKLGGFLKGRGVTRDESVSGNLACVRYGELYTTHNNHIKTFYSWISREVSTTATRLEQGDILFAGSGETKDEIGKCAAFVDDIEAYAGGDIIILRNKNADSLFLGYYLNTGPINRQKASRGQGDAIVHIGAEALADIQCELPYPPEQRAIATILSDMDAEITALEAKLSKACQIKQGMMQKLLTGMIRLI